MISGKLIGTRQTNQAIPIPSTRIASKLSQIEKMKLFMVHESPTMTDNLKRSRHVWIVLMVADMFSLDNIWYSVAQ